MALPSNDPPAVPSIDSAYRSPLLGFPGAVAADGPDSGIAWHYGDPIGEQRAAERGAAVFDLSHRGVIAVSGPERLTWLNTLTSQLLTDLPTGAVTQALVLSPNGHVDDPGKRYLIAMPMRALQTTGRTGQINACLAVRRLWETCVPPPPMGGGSAGAVAASRARCETGHEASAAAHQQPINDRIERALAPGKGTSRENAPAAEGGRADPGQGCRLLPSNRVLSESARLQNLNN